MIRTGVGRTSAAPVQTGSRADGRTALLIAAGAVGTVLLAASTWWAGAVPTYFAARHDSLPVLSWLPLRGGVPAAAAWAGLVLLLASWALLGRRVLQGRAGSLRAATLGWTLPWLAALPYGTRDPWAYAAQGDMVFRGLDPYVATPARVGGPFAAEVGSRWIDNPAPYGPLWLQFGRLVRALCGEHAVLTVLVYRLPVLAAVLVIAWLVHRLAGVLGVDARRAVWLCALNPLTLVLGLGGLHNDLVMVALMLGGLLTVVSVRGSWRPLLWAGLWCALAAAVKAPAVVTLAFAVPVWWMQQGSRDRDRTRLIVACVVAAASFAVVFGALTLVSGWGFGWTRQLGADVSVVNWTSLPTAVVLVYRLVTGDPHTEAVTDALRTVRTVGTGLTVVVLIGAWFAGLKRQPMFWAGLGFVALIVLGAAVQPWYLCWALPFLALTPLPRWGLVALAAVSLAWPLFIQPDGRSAVMEPIALAYVAVGAVVAWAVLRNATQGRRLTTTPSTPGPV